MEHFEETVKESSKRGSSFFDHVFRLDEQQQGSLLNILQYTVLAFVPIIAVLYVIRTYVPDPDDHKGSLLILAEVLGQIFFMFIAIYFIHRMISYIPTYSGYRYSEFNFTTIILGLLLILLSIKTKLGEKVQILVERAQELWTGESAAHGQSQGQDGGNVRVTQPFSQQYTGGGGQGMLPNTQLTTARGSGASSAYGLGQATQAPGNGNNFNNVYANTMTPMVNAAVPAPVFEPMAANEALGGFTSF